MCYDLRLGIGSLWKLITQGFGNFLVESLPSTLEQTFICSILDERVFEAVDCVWYLAAAKHKLCLFELEKTIPQRRVIAPGQSAQQWIRELLAGAAR